MKIRSLRALVVVSAVIALAAPMATGAAGQTASGQKPAAAAGPAPVPPRALTAHLVGHAHIDLSWLWRWEETVSDIARYTFKGTLAQMDKMPGLTFAQSQAAIYDAIEKDQPELFAEISKKIKEGHLGAGRRHVGRARGQHARRSKRSPATACTASASDPRHVRRTPPRSRAG